METIQAIWCFMLTHQTLSAGFMALFAAIGSGALFYRNIMQADLHRKDDIHRATQARLFALAPQLAHVRHLCRQHSATVRVLQNAGNNSPPPSDAQIQRLKFPEISDPDDWLAILSLDEESVRRMRQLDQEIRFHNWRMAPGTTFISIDFRQEIIGRIGRIQTNATFLEQSIQSHSGPTKPKGWYSAILRKYLGR